MKRFATTICLAACLAFLCGGIAMAQNSVVVQSKTVLPGATGVTAGIMISNAVSIQGAVFPFEIRTVSNGAYMMTAFSVAIPPANRMGASPLGATYTPAANVTNKKYDLVSATDCSTLPGHSYTTGAAQIGFTSPDAFMHATVSTGDPGVGDKIDMDPGADPSFAAASIVLTFNVNSNQGDFDIDTCCVTPANHLSFVDMNTAIIAPSFTKGTITIYQPPNQCPNVTAQFPTVNATVGSQASNQITGTDPDVPPDLPITYYLVGGSKGAVDASGMWTYTPGCGDLAGFDVTVGALDAAHTMGQCPNSVVTFHVNVAADNAVASCGADIAPVHWGAAISKTITATGGCGAYTFSADIGSIDNTGKWTYTTTCNDVGPAKTVNITVTPAQGGAGTCSFKFSVTNADVATCTNPADISIEGSTILGPAGPQGDGDALTYAIVSGTGWPGEGIVGNVYNSGTRPSGNSLGYTITFSVSDGCSSAQCSFKIFYQHPLTGCIRVVDTSVLSGTTVTVRVHADDWSVPGEAGGYDLLLCYDRSALSFLKANGGPSHWEYFTYRTGMFGGNCGSGCPNGFIRLLSIRDMNNGVPSTGITVLNGQDLATLTFLVSADRNFINTCLHIGFCAYDCGDNSISDKTGDTTWTPTYRTDDSSVTFDPAYPAVCPSTNKNKVEPKLRFCPGRICVIPPPDDRGDINLNGIPNEIGDAVLYSNYFIYGVAVFTANEPAGHRQAQILASDINADGIPLTVADLIYLIRILTGDAQPFANGQPKMSPYANSVNVISEVSNGALNISTNSNVDLGGAVLVFRYSGVNVGTPSLSAAASGLTMKSVANNGELRVLVYSNAKGARVPAGSNSLVSVPVNGDGTIELVETQFSDYNGSLLSVTAAKAGLPADFALLQNYPNPFNAGTVIPIALKGTSEYRLTIYNVAGQAVRTFSGTGTGIVRVAWDGTASDGSPVASGMYFYRVNAGDFSATKKMVLLK